jgi:transcriptional regulator with XRE-family HTH domain
MDEVERPPYSGTVPRSRSADGKADTDDAVLSRLVGANLRLLREGLGLTQGEFREKTRVPGEEPISQSQLSHLENGKGLRQLVRLAELVRRAGGDPMDLVRTPTAGEPLDPIAAEIVTLLGRAPLPLRVLVRDLIRGLLPIVPTVDPQARELIDLFADIGPEGRDLLLALARREAGKPTGPESGSGLE